MSAANRRCKPGHQRRHRHPRFHRRRSSRPPRDSTSSLPITICRRSCPTFPPLPPAPASRRACRGTCRLHSPSSTPISQAAATFASTYAAPGVAFGLAQALLEADGIWSGARNKILPSFLEMLAIATVADAVPLLGENRVIASIGLEQLKRPASPGLRSLMQVAKLDPKQRTLTATDLAFRIAPRINAAGRMDVASDVVELFTTRDTARAAEVSLQARPPEQRTSTGRSRHARPDKSAAFARIRPSKPAAASWSKAKAGIAASSVFWPRASSTVRGARRWWIALEDGEAYGSGRSVPGFHLLHAIESCKQLFTRFGGHSHAVGFSLPASRLPEFGTDLEAWAVLHVEESGAQPTLPCGLPLDQITQSSLHLVTPPGASGKWQRGALSLSLTNRGLTAPVRPIKERHICLQLAQGARGASWPALGWDWAARVQALGLEQGSVIHIAYKLRENVHPEYGGARTRDRRPAPRVNSGHATRFLHHLRRPG